MQTKLTIRLEQELITQAKFYAKQSGKSLSQLIADYFVQLQQQPTTSASTNPLPPITAQLCGVLQSTDIIDSSDDRQDYRDYLAAKYQ